MSPVSSINRRAFLRRSSGGVVALGVGMSGALVVNATASGSPPIWKYTNTWVKEVARFDYEGEAQDLIDEILSDELLGTSYLSNTEWKDEGAQEVRSSTAYGTSSKISTTFSGLAIEEWFDLFENKTVYRVVVNCSGTKWVMEPEV